MYIVHTASTCTCPSPKLVICTPKASAASWAVMCARVFSLCCCSSYPCTQVPTAMIDWWQHNAQQPLVQNMRVTCCFTYKCKLGNTDGRCQVPGQHAPSRYSTRLSAIRVQAKGSTPRSLHTNLEDTKHTCRDHCTRL